METPESPLARTDLGLVASWYPARPDVLPEMLRVNARTLPKLALLALAVFWLPSCLSIPAALAIIGVTLNWFWVPPPAVRRMAQEPAIGPAYPVKATLTYQGLEYGSDRGVVAFSDGWLHYEGLGFTCSFRTDDCSVHPYQMGVRLSFAGGWGMKLTVYPRWVDDGPLNDARTVRADVDAWTAAEVPNGEPVYPPRRFQTKPSPDWLLGVAATGCVVCAVGCLWLPNVAFRSFSIVLACTAAYLFYSWLAGHRAFKELRDIRETVLKKTHAKSL